jgi:AcrR family transcriptional regulator
MAEIAEVLGVAKGTLYGYVESKEALFDASIRFADRPSEGPTPGELPIKTPASGQTVGYVRERLARESEELVLVKVVQGTLLVNDVVDELKTVLSDLYDRFAHNRYVIKLIDRCAADHPELARVWFGEGRWAQHGLLVHLLGRRSEGGNIRRFSNLDVVARTLLETMAFWAVHRHFDPAPQTVDDIEARDTAVSLLVHGLLDEKLA